MSQTRLSNLSYILLLLALSACQVQATPTAVPPTAVPTAEATGITVDSIPSGSPLTLVWQTGGAPEEIMQDPIHLAMDPRGNIYVGSATPTELIRVFDPNGNF